MAMPNHFVLVRHGESEGNIATRAGKQGDLSFFTDEFRDRPNHEMRLTPTGVDQAESAGRWIQTHIIEEFGLPGFDRYMYSPHRRTRETAGHLGLPDAEWRMNRFLREREWGEIQGLPHEEHQRLYPRNYEWKQRDPLHWVPPGGESLVQVADNRVREVHDTLHRDHDEKGVDSVIAVVHGEWIWSDELTLGYMSNEDWAEAERDPTRKVHNCQTQHFMRLNPVTGEQASYLRWMRSVTPWKDEANPGEWIELGRQTMTNEQLLAQVEELPRLFDYDEAGQPIPPSA